MTATATETYVNENRRPIHSAVLFSSFPADVIAKTREELLTRFGVDIQEVMPVERQRGIKGAMERHELVLIHHEMGSHKDTGRIKKLAKSLEKEAIPVSRKSSAWEEQLRYRLHPAPTPSASKRVVPDENMEGFLREYVSLKEKGYSLGQMLQPLSRFRATGSFEAPQQIAVVVSKLLKGERAPGWFREWDKAFVEPKPLPEGASASGEVTPPVSSEPVKAVPQEDEHELAQIYASENADLREKIAELEDQNKHLAAGGKAWASKIADHIKALVDEGVVTKEAGFEMMMAAASTKAISK